MKIYYLVVLLLLVAPFQKSEIKLEIGAKLKRSDVPKKVSEMIMTHPAQLRPFIKKNIAGVECLIAYDEKSREIKYIHTKDKNFRTANGLGVGSVITVAKTQLTSYPGWEIRAPITEDGWYPIVGYDSIIQFYPSALLVYVDKMDSMSVEIIGFSKGGN